jgi:hypothetical protein
VRGASATQETESWPGWSPDRLLDFIVRRADLGARAPELASPSAPPVGPTGTPILRQIAAVAPGAERPNSIPPHGQPFQVRLVLDLGDIVVPSEQSLSYGAAVRGKRIGTRARETLGQVRGETAPTGKLELNIAARQLPKGLYRLEALVDLGLASSGPGTAGRQETLLEGGLLQFY